MAIFDKLGETLVSAGKEVTQKAKDISGVAKLNLDIKAKEDFVQKQYAEIGKLYYEAHKDDVEIEFEQFTVIDEALEAVETMKKELLELKGAKKCPKCGAQVPENSEFCSSCGTKLDIFED